MKPYLHSKSNFYTLLILLISAGYAYLHYFVYKSSNNVQYSDLFYDMFCNKYVINNSNTYCYDKANLASGLLLGMANFSSDFKNKFVTLGLIHLIIASGSQIVYLSDLIQNGLIRISIHRKFRFLFTVLGCFMYLYYIGFTPPLIRGFISYTLINLLAVYWGRFIHPLRALVWTFSIVVVLSPNLLFSKSLHLSILATAGIHLSNRYFDENKFKILFEQLLIVFLTFPIIMTFNSYFNPFSIILNIILGVLIPYIMILIICSIFIIVFPGIGYLITFVIDSILVVINYFESISNYFIVEVITFTTQQTMIYYSLLISFIIAYDYLFIYNSNNKLQLDK